MLQIRDSLGYKRPWVRERAKRGYLEYNYAAEIHWVDEDSLGYVTTRADATHEILWVK